MRRLPILLAGLAVCAAPWSGCAAVPEAPPTGPPPGLPHYEGAYPLVDDGAASPEFAAFRDRLRGIVARRDTAGLLALVAPDARLSFGSGPGGPAGFRRTWFGGGPPGGEPVWTVLERALAGGSLDEDGAVTVPFVPALWPSDLDPFAHVAVVRRGVPALDAPGGATVALLSEIALPILAPPLGGWWQVRLPDGQAAFVPADKALSPVGYRAVFWDDGDGWLLRSFLGGD